MPKPKQQNEKQPKNHQAFRVIARNKDGSIHSSVIAYGEREVQRLRSLHHKYGAILEVVREPSQDREKLPDPRRM